jgi:purine nucleoside phosphorylase
MAEIPIRIGVIGGSGLYSMEGLSDVEERRISTPFGDPSDVIVIGNLEGVRVAFLARHGRGHRIMPTEVNYRANIYALKTLGRGAGHLHLRLRLPAGAHPPRRNRHPRPVV